MKYIAVILLATAVLGSTGCQGVSDAIQYRIFGEPTEQEKAEREAWVNTHMKRER